MTESTKPTPDLDTRLRDALLPVLDLEDDEMLDNAIVIYTVVYPNGDGLRYINSSKMPPWVAKGMITCYLEMLPSSEVSGDEGDDD